MADYMVDRAVFEVAVKGKGWGYSGTRQYADFCTPSW